jgi:hypothetical protein
MQRRKGALSPTKYGIDVLPTLHKNGIGGSSPQVNDNNNNNNNNNALTSKSTRRCTLASLVSHGMVAFVVFVFTTSFSIKDTNHPSDLLTTASFYLPHYCPTSIVEYIDQIGNRLAEERRNAPLHRVQPPTRSSKMTPVPSVHRKTFYYDGDKISQPIARAFRSRGWQQVDSPRNAHVIYTYSNNADWAATLQPWQRFNYIPGYRKWNKKDTFAYYYKQWEARHQDRPPSMYVPETYLLTESEREIKAFAKVLQNGGSKYPWVHKKANVNQGKVSRFGLESLMLVVLS